MTGERRLRDVEPGTLLVCSFGSTDFPKLGPTAWFMVIVSVHPTVVSYASIDDGEERLTILDEQEGEQFCEMVLSTDIASNSVDIGWQIADTGERISGW